MEAADVEFIAEKLLIKIVPNFTHNKIYLISGDVGPFRPGLPVEVIINTSPLKFFFI